MSVLSSKWLMMETIFIKFTTNCLKNSYDQRHSKIMSNLLEINVTNQKPNIPSDMCKEILAAWRKLQ